MLALDFRITVLAAAGVFGLLTVAQLVALPQHRADSEREKHRSCRTGGSSFATVRF